MKKPKTLKEIRDHELVDEVSDERGSGDGIWIYLIKGYTTNLECGIIHEHTVAECLEEWDSIKKS